MFEAHPYIGQASNRLVGVPVAFTRSKETIIWWGSTHQPCINAVLDFEVSLEFRTIESLEAARNS